MAKTDFKSVDAYIASKPPEARPLLERVRAILKRALPGAVEVISYQIPAYKQGGRTVVFFAGWASHFSLYPVSDALVAAFDDELLGYEHSKGTLRFPLGKRPPATLITRIAKHRAQEVAGQLTAKAAATKKPAPKKAGAKKRVSKRAR
jgi:uncharacterized protein YdhG (YjbR/CyaY superfamily)